MALDIGNAAVVLPPLVEADEVPAFTVKAEDASQFPKFETTGWGPLEAVRMSSPCFAWITRDKSMGRAIPGKGNVAELSESITETEHPNRIYEAPAHIDEFPDQDMASYARHNFANMIDRERMVAVEPDENNQLHVPEGMRPVLLTVWKKTAFGPQGRTTEYHRHWFTADQPKTEDGPVTWSHWDGESTPSRNAGPSPITDPWNQCASGRYTPVSYFLMPTMDGQ